MKRVIAATLLLCAGLWCLAQAQEGRPVGPNPTAVGTAAVGQIPGTPTNDNASAGNVGELVVSGTLHPTTATVTFTNASPTVVSWTANPFFTRLGDGATAIPACASLVSFTNSGGALPTGVTSGTPYYVTCGASLTANAFQISTSTANAIAGTSVNTSSTGTGTQTGSTNVPISSGAQVDFGALSLSAGDWDVSGVAIYSPGATTSITAYQETIGTTSGSASFGTAYTVSQRSFAAEVPTGGNSVELMTPTRVSLSALTSLFCTMNSAFTVTSTINGAGMCRARRVR